VKKILVFAIIIPILCVAGEIVKTFNFSPDEIEVKSIQGYDYLTLNGCFNFSDSGKPSLPYKSVRFAIPASAIITDVEVVNSSQTQFVGFYSIFPSQKPVPVSFPGSQEFIPQDKSVYESNVLYPGESFKRLATGNMNGFRIAQMLFYPVQYLPKDQKIKLYTSMTIRVSFKENVYTVIPKTEEQIKMFAEAVKTFVVNPEQVDEYAPPERPVDTGWDHVIITHNALKSDWDDFRSFICSTYGMTDTVITTEYIYNNFAGVDNQEKIRNFVIDAVNTHSTQYILLGGDVEIVPHRKTFIFETGYNPWCDTIPCDLYYADLDGNWDGNNNGTYGELDDGVDMYPDVWVGRATVDLSADITRFTNRFIDYYNTNSHRTNILLAGFDLDNNTFGESTMEFYNGLLPNSYVKKRVYDSHSGNHKDTVETAINDGQNIIFHTDHGGALAICCGGYHHNWSLRIDDIDALTNQPEYCIFTSPACNIGCFDRDNVGSPDGDCIMEHFMNAPSGGAVCAMTNARFGYYSPNENPQTSYSAAFMTKSFDRIFNHSPGSGIDFLLGKADLIPIALSNRYYRWSMYALNLFGDPIQTIHIPYVIGIQEEKITKAMMKNARLEIYPNPFRELINISFSRGQSIDAIELRIYDVTGRMVRSFPVVDLCNPKNSVVSVCWNGTDDRGNRVSAGIYFVRFVIATTGGTEGFNQTKKVVLLK
jgi:hypothetical protein